MKKGSVKNTRINAEVMRELSVAIRDLKDPRVSPMTSVTDAEVTPDLQYCKVYISVLGSEESLAKTMEASCAVSLHRPSISGTHQSFSSSLITPSCMERIWTS